MMIDRPPEALGFSIPPDLAVRAREAAEKLLDAIGKVIVAARALQELARYLDGLDADFVESLQARLIADWQALPSSLTDAGDAAGEAMSPDLLLSLSRISRLQLPPAFSPFGRWPGSAHEAAFQLASDAWSFFTSAQGPIPLGDELSHGSDFVRQFADCPRDWMNEDLQRLGDDVATCRAELLNEWRAVPIGAALNDAAPAADENQTPPPLEPDWSGAHSPDNWVRVFGGSASWRTLKKRIDEGELVAKSLTSKRWRFDRNSLLPSTRKRLDEFEAT